MNLSVPPCKDTLVRYFESRAYLLSVALLVMFGHLLGIEYYLNILVILQLSAALCLSDSPKPLIYTSSLFIFQVTLRHSPSEPYFSDYYFRGAKLVILLILAVVLVGSIAYYLIRTRFVPDVLQGNMPMCLPLFLFSVALIIGGIGRTKYVAENLTYGLGQAAVWFLHFGVLAVGMRRMKKEEILTALSDVAMAATWIILIQLAEIYLTTDGILNPDQWVDKNRILFGWGISNTAGAILAFLLPVHFIGIVRTPRPALPITTAIAGYIGIFLTQSRNAMVFGTLGLAASIVYVCFIGEHKKFFRIVTGAVFGVGLLVILFCPDIRYMLIQQFIERGFNDAGRFRIWEQALDNFLKSPVFGRGFFGTVEVVDSDKYVEFYPHFVHNTLLQLLSSTGLVGTLSYVFVRAASATPFLRRGTRTPEKWFLLFAVVVFLCEGLLDVFPFAIYPTFYYNFFLAAAFALDSLSGKEAERTNET